MKTLLIILGILLSVVTNAQSLKEARILVKEKGVYVEAFTSKTDGYTYKTDGNKLVISKEGKTLKSTQNVTYRIKDELLTDCYNSGSYKKSNFPGITLEKNGNSTCIVCNGCRFTNVDEFIFKSEGALLQAFIENLDKVSSRGILQ